MLTEVRQMQLYTSVPHGLQAEHWRLLLETGCDVVPSLARKIE